MFLNHLNDSLWSVLFLPLFALCGASLILRSHALPLRRFGSALRMAIGKEEGRRDGLSSAQAVSTALAATVGTGNIVGTAQAIALGGPGAVFWMWIASLLGMMIKYAEILQGQRFQNGAMGYVKAALGKVPARIYALFGLLSTLAVGNMAQMNGVMGALGRLFPGDRSAVRFFSAAILTLLVGICVSGGALRIGRIMERTIPAVAVSYLVLTGSVLIAFRARLPGAMSEILQGAISTRGILGGIGGAALRESLVWGLKRGAFSNEAGLGTAANIHAGVKSAEPAIHALWGVFEVFADTILVCSFTALAILCSGVEVPWGTMPGAELLESAIAQILGQGAAGVYTALILLLFGLSTVIGCFVNAERCAIWLLGARGTRLLLVPYLSCAFLGCLMPLDLVWQLADSVNVLQSVPNLLALLILAPESGREARKALRPRNRGHGSS